ncbi:hypothetical protein HRI_000209300 [Hibiscus trionum]|uniref:Uncharacterized protein n=1 Tax=Hibiscus trionum TaxID=183268 RepID=A0A9W7GTL4_HIBTR|nr:hypothetical protein HRI_000209300 [Hibiscus trionum]
MAAAAHLRMEEQINGRNGVSVPPKSNLSYVVTITIPQPSIRIKVPRVFVKAVHSIKSHNQSESGSNNMKKHWDMSKRIIRKKVGSMFSKVFGSSNAEDVALGGNVDDDGGMNKLRDMLKRVDSKKNTGKFDCSGSFRLRRSGSSHGHGRMLKSAWWMKRMGRKTEKQELCSKRILMGKKCRPVE